MHKIDDSCHLFGLLCEIHKKILKIGIIIFKLNSKNYILIKFNYNEFLFILSLV